MYLYLKYAGRTVQMQTLASKPVVTTSGLGSKNSMQVMASVWHNKKLCS